MAIGSEQGYNGQLVSLAGRLGRPGVGLKVNNTVYTGVGIATQLIPANSDRVWMIIQNSGLLKTNLAFGPDGGGYATASHIYLEAGATLQIDKLLPWSGSMSAFAAGDVVLSVAEASVIE